VSSVGKNENLAKPIATIRLKRPQEEAKLAAGDGKSSRILPQKYVNHYPKSGTELPIL
jgi:hypothetical protein